MSVRVNRRGGQYPVRLSLNITEYMAQQLDRWAHRASDTRGNVARLAIKAGLPVLAASAREQLRQDVEGEPPARVGDLNSLIGPPAAGVDKSAV